MPLRPVRYGIISDLHSNLEALTVAFAWLEKNGIKDVICLGDIVGYNADPKAAIAVVRQKCKLSLRGNHDRYVLGEEAKGVREEKVEVIEWTKAQLSQDEIAYLRGLPDSHIFEGTWLLCHGSPRDKDEYILSNDAISANMKHLRDEFLGIDIALFGHSHLPMAIGAGQVETKFPETKTVQIQRAKTYMINPGSVGQPRDKCPLTAFGVFDVPKWSFTVVRQPYDITATQKKIKAAGLDPSLATRLQHGR